MNQEILQDLHSCMRLKFLKTPPTTPNHSAHDHTTTQHQFTVMLNPRVIHVDKCDWNEAPIYTERVDWSSDDRMIVAAKRGGLGFWDPATLQLVAETPALDQLFTRRIYHDVSFSPCSQFVAASQGAFIAISDVRSLENRPIFCSQDSGSRRVGWAIARAVYAARSAPDDALPAWQDRFG